MCVVLIFRFTAIAKTNYIAQKEGDLDLVLGDQLEILAVGTDERSGYYKGATFVRNFESIFDNWA